MSKDDVIKLVLKDVDPKNVQHYVNENGMDVYMIGKLNVEKLKQFIINNMENI